MFIIFQIILFVMLCVVLPQLMYIVLVGFVGYVICKTMGRKTIGQMIVLLCVFTSLTLVIEKAQPMINRYNESKQQIEQYTNILNDDNIIEDNKNDVKKIWDFLNRYPN